ncbi:2-polyprenyl-3-methyl-5-hydroxy-6-metoxy-1,4-benzoquinol methylase [Alkalibacillus filiformis]|uniref:2-polyprenyl-3-methyl-5-hydroxy-6-metoxy-1, 4-benzoquinol methylase n=1 Tax=Alkalibacillus filiformis TaxID=200990 RepID=A0ABU0DRN0_9BACI|nr:class I SAM-dependent methyltransferase [Alkalibacillus filiformis]MDQ0351087.1 2-polyprenyl-3-methyl-5-hydroxy-6-metoxy-1,4-benzoquinol methylase [Alkalibacillus filiformis]
MYKEMAQVYDELMNDAPYDKWVDFTKQATKPYSKRASSCLLDVGCGTGEVSVRLAEQGYEVTAFDQSEEMIDHARAKMEHDQEIQFLKADATDFKLNKNFDVVVSYCDVVNYLTEENSLTKAFNQIYDHLTDDGVFIFDIHSQGYVEFLLDSEMFSEVRDDVSYVWFCEGTKRPYEVVHDLTFFVQTDYGLYKRFDETHKQRTFPVEQYKHLLSSIGFQKVTVCSDFSFEYREDADRLFFICQK